MNKLDMAHEYAMKCIGNPNVSVKTNNEIIAFAWQYADAMQAEADKRNNKETCDKNIGLDSSVLKPSNSMELEWQPDWSQAPKGVEGWKANPEGTYSWTSRNGGHVDSAPSFGYQGNWQESLRKRPQ